MLGLVGLLLRSLLVQALNLPGKPLVVLVPFPVQLLLLAHERGPLFEQLLRSLLHLADPLTGLGQALRQVLDLLLEPCLFTFDSLPDLHEPRLIFADELRLLAQLLLRQTNFLGLRLNDRILLLQLLVSLHQHGLELLGPLRRHLAQLNLLLLNK